MRVLFVTPYLPSLIRVRPYNFIKQLSKRHEITLVALAHGDPCEDEAISSLQDYCENIYTVPLTKIGAITNCCRRLLSKMPLQAAYTEVATGKDFISRIVKNGNFDLIHVEHIRGAHLTENALDIPRVYDSVDCITRLLEQKRAGKCGSLQRALNSEELYKMRGYEPMIAASFDSVVITSDSDRKALEQLVRKFVDRIQSKQMPIDERRKLRTLMEESQNLRLDRLSTGSKISVVPNGVDSDYFQPVESAINPTEIVFSGKMGYFANASAVLHFYKNVFPLIRKKKPDARFKIVGSEPPDEVRKLAADPAVEVTGYVSDIRPHLASAAVVVCPLTIGVGVQNKVLEAMSMGKPVVATSIAMNGIPDVTDEYHAICADSPHDISQEVISIIDDPGRGRRLGDNARRLAVETYSWEAAARKLESVYEQTVDRNAILKAAA